MEGQRCHLMSLPNRIWARRLPVETLEESQRLRAFVRAYVCADRPELNRLMIQRV